MELLVAAGHFVGAIASVGLLGLFIALINSLDQKRTEKRMRQEVAIAFGVPMNEVDNEELERQIMEFLAGRYSAELFRNRLADLCGTVRTAWSWLNAGVQVVILGGVAWVVLTRDVEAAPYAWLIVPVMFVAWLIEVAFALLCRFATGRYPGQPKLVRRILAESIEARTAVPG